MRERPIGVFDSGVGGLSVVRELRRALPFESLVYVADTAYCPYGDRPDSEVLGRALAIARHLVSTGAKLLVVACNTASGVALEELRAAVAVPVVGLEPAVKTGVACSPTGKVAVLATTSTLRSRRFARLLANHASGVQVIAQACPGLVELIEQGQLDGEAMRARLRELTEPLRSAGVDAVVLGCTHYPFVKAALARLLGPDVALVDSGAAIARRAEQLLGDHGLRCGSRLGSLQLFTTGDPVPVKAIAEHLWGAELSIDAIQV